MSDHLRLALLRRHLFLSQSEAAKVFGVSERSWRRWEQGKSPVPADIQVRMDDLARERADAMDSLLQAINRIREEKGDDFVLCFLVFDKLEDYQEAHGEGLAHWRIHLSLAAEMIALFGGQFVPVVFDREAYFSWLREHGYADSSEMRARWAELQVGSR